MKILTLLGLALFCHTNVNGKNIVKLRGNIQHRLSDSVMVSYAYTSIDYKPIEYYATLDKNGNFSFEFEVRSELTKIEITTGSQQTELYVQPGSDLSLSIDGNNFDSSIHYSGEGSEIANFNAQLLLAQYTLNDFNTNAQALSAKEPKEFEAGIKDMERQINGFLNNHGQNLPASYKEYFKTDYHYMVYYAMQMYPRIHEMIKQKSNEVNNIPIESYAILDDIPYEFNDNYMPVSSYRDYLENLVVLKVRKEFLAHKILPESSITDSIYARAYRLMPPKTAEFYLGRHIYYSLKTSPANEVEKRYETYKAHFPKGEYLKVLSDEISFKKNMGPGKPAIDFEILTPEGKKMKLSDLKGKVVYIDFWSRSCAPCIAELSEVKKIRAHFKDKPVVFVYVSLNDDEETWKKAIKELEINGINTHAGDQYKSETAKKYGIVGIPSYFLVDREGKFANVAVVERPGDTDKLIAQIEELLK